MWLILGALVGCQNPETPCAQGPYRLTVGLETASGLVDPNGRSPDAPGVQLEVQGDERGVRVGWQASGPQLDRILRGGLGDVTLTHTVAVFYYQDGRDQLESGFREAQDAPSCGGTSADPLYEGRDIWMPIDPGYPDDAYFTITTIVGYERLSTPHVPPGTSFGFQIAND